MSDMHQAWPWAGGRWLHGRWGGGGGRVWGDTTRRMENPKLWPDQGLAELDCARTRGHALF